MLRFLPTGGAVSVFILTHHTNTVQHDLGIIGDLGHTFIPIILKPNSWCRYTSMAPMNTALSPIPITWGLA
jgi:hypothetical protein